ncbi:MULTISPECIES: LCP family protein [Corynebacterium]|uniref:LCP family glycopolymer transferase n=1 Tax=Corynebacterium TaxID=1716 RepID=UPI001EF3E980|nr:MULTISPECIES: LCP family protein [Corynebacterium]MDN8623989.1 LCP family protein [Corynebacterium kroppenstedtii]
MGRTDDSRGQGPKGHYWRGDDSHGRSSHEHSDDASRRGSYRHESHPSGAGATDASSDQPGAGRRGYNGSTRYSSSRHSPEDRSGHENLRDRTPRERGNHRHRSTDAYRRRTSYAESSQPSRNRGRPANRAAGARVIQAPPNARPSHKQVGSRTVKSLLVVMALVCVILPAIGYKAIGGLGNEMASAGNLKLGEKGKAKDGATDILLVGADSRTDAKGNPLSEEEAKMLRAGDDVATLNTDTIVLIRVPNDGSSATAISIPRDSYIHTKDLGNTKINAVFGATKFEKEKDLQEEGKDKDDIDKESTEAGRSALIDAVANLTGITVDHYAEVGLLGFVLLTNAVGGVEVCLNNDVDDDFSGAHFKKGKQTLDGADALSFVRQRHGLPRGDLDRIARQQAFMASLAHKVLSTGTLTNTSKISKLSEAVERSVVLDNDWDVMSFATQMQDVAGGHVSFQTIPTTSLDGTGDNGESIVTVDPDAVKAFVAKTVGEEPPKKSDDNHKDSDESQSESSTDDEEPIERDFMASQYTVTVTNGSSITGLASRISKIATSEGYAEGNTANDMEGTSQTSVVKAADPDSRPAKFLAQKLHLKVEQDSSLSDNEINVYLTNDYTGPGKTEDSLQNYLDGEESDDSNDGDAYAGSSSDAAPGEKGDINTQPGESPKFDAGDSPKCVN